jgi:glycosyltransferase involved in cell wall biosynthesis
MYPNEPLISISDHQRCAVDDLQVHWAATVYNGLDLSRYHAAAAKRGEHLVFVGRISPEKGPALAVEIAHRAGRALHVAAKIDPVDVEYYRTEIEPLFRTHHVSFLGELEEPDKPAFYAAGAATLFPSDWPEPFGLVMIESMAAGTPVIALRRGSVPEIVIDGVTGFVCDTVAEMVDAVDRLGDIDPDACRRRAASFEASHMCAAYQRVYHSIIRNRQRQLTGAA